MAPTLKELVTNAVMPNSTIVSSAPRVLIVEDEALLAMELEGLLIEAGYDVVGWALSAAEAKQQAALHRPDITFVDVHLADGATGVDVARHLLAADQPGWVVFLTANASRVPDDLTDAVGIVAKPYTSSGMMSVLRFLEEGMRQPPPRSAPPSGLALSAKYASAWQT